MGVEGNLPAPGFVPEVGVPAPAAAGGPTGLPAAALNVRMRVICALTKRKCRSYSHAACLSKKGVSTPNSAARAGQSISSVPTRSAPSTPAPSPPVLPSVDDAEGPLPPPAPVDLGRAMSFHSRLSLAGVQSTCGGSAKLPRGKGRRTMTVYCTAGLLRVSLDGAMAPGWLVIDLIGGLTLCSLKVEFMLSVWSIAGNGLCLTWHPFTD